MGYKILNNNFYLRGNNITCSYTNLIPHGQGGSNIIGPKWVIKLKLTTM